MKDRDFTIVEEKGCGFREEATEREWMTTA